MKVPVIELKYNTEKHVYFISYSKLPSNISAAVYEGYIGVGIVVNYHTGIIEDVSCTLLTEVARNFLKGIIIGFSLYDDIEPLIDDIKLHFHGFSQKSVCVIMHENFRRYHEWENENQGKLAEQKKKCDENTALKEIPNLETMKVYPEHSIYLISYARIPQNNSLAFFKGALGIGFVIELPTNLILDCCGTFITDEAEDFIKSLSVGKKFNSEADVDCLVELVKFNFHCSAQKAACVIFRSNFTIFTEWKNENIDYLNTFIV
ncbi:MAG: DUF3870 domain-containing protein [Spirochaetales bacterium]|nr:DUF3870 domain-containing protein [Spirochaetales bacterium]